MFLHVGTDGRGKRPWQLSLGLFGLLRRKDCFDYGIVTSLFSTFTSFVTGVEYGLSKTSRILDTLIGVLTGDMVTVLGRFRVCRTIFEVMLTGLALGGLDRGDLELIDRLKIFLRLYGRSILLIIRGFDECANSIGMDEIRDDGLGDCILATGDDLVTRIDVRLGRGASSTFAIGMECRDAFGSYGSSGLGIFSGLRRCFLCFLISDSIKVGELTDLGDFGVDEITDSSDLDGNVGRILRLINVDGRINFEIGFGGGACVTFCRECCRAFDDGSTYFLDLDDGTLLAGSGCYLFRVTFDLGGDLLTVRRAGTNSLARYKCILDYGVDRVCAFLSVDLIC